MIIFTGIFICVGLFMFITELLKCFRRTVLTKGVIIDIFYKKNMTEMVVA